MIKEDEKLWGTKVDITNTGYKINNNNPVGVLEPIRRKLSIEKIMLIPIQKAQIRDNLQVCVSCDIIETQLLLNYS